MAAGAPVLGGGIHGSDAGSPVQARLRAQVSRLSRYQGIGASAAEPYDPDAGPLEAMVEAEPASTVVPDLRGAAETGLQLLRALEEAGLGKYGPAYVKERGLQPTAADLAGLNADAAAFVSILRGRVPDGVWLYDELDQALRGTAPALPNEPQVDAGDNAPLTDALLAWLAWCDALEERPAGGGAWRSDRLEYSFAVGAPAAGGEVAFVAPAHQGGRLDWTAFDVDARLSLGASGDPVESLVSTVVPSPARFRGMPDLRWWAFEDHDVHFGAVDAGPEDLGRMVLMEFALIYGNDFFVIPVDLSAGSACLVRSLVITDTFGERLLISPTDPGGGPWRMFRQSDATGGVPPEWFLLAPAVMAGPSGEPVEEVLFLRDEMANLAWAVERRVAAPAGGAVELWEAEQRERAAAERAADDARAAAPDSGAEPADALAYRLATKVPRSWTPLVPVRIGAAAAGQVAFQLRPMLDDSGAPLLPRGRLLREAGPNATFPEEEVPRAGLRIVRKPQLVRWTAGTTHLWTGRHAGPGRGAGSSGLRFDTAVPERSR